MMDRKEAADLLDNLIGMVEDNHGEDYDTALKMGIEALSSANGDMISRHAAIDAFWKLEAELRPSAIDAVLDMLKNLPSAQPEQRYTEEELRVFQHGISLSLLSKRSSQHWQYDEDTATEIKFLERLYEKVVADMRGEQDGRFNQQTGGD